MNPSVYLETTIPSYLTAWRSPDLIMAARQQITRAWWDDRRQDFDLFTSEVVLLERNAKMKLDPVLAEIRQVREAYAAQFKGDIRTMMDDIRRRQKESGRLTVAREPRRIEIPQGSASPHN